MAKRILGFRETSARRVLATTLTLALALGTLPTNAVKAAADELTGLDEEVELVEPELEAADDADGELVVTIGEDVPNDADQDGDEVADNEATLQAEDEVEPQVFEAELEGIRAKLTVAADVELPEGSRLVITKIEAPVAAEAQDAADEDAAEPEAEDELVATQDQDAAEAAQAEDGENVADSAKKTAPMKGTEVVLAAMNDAIAADRAENAPDDKDTYEVANAYVVEVVDGEDHAVQLGKDQATLEIAMPQDDELLQADGLYAVERVEVEDPEASDEAEAAPLPAVSAFAEDEYETDEDAADATRYAAQATDAADAVAQEDDADEATVALEGVASIAAVKKAEPQEEPAAAPATAPKLAAPGGPLKAPVDNPSYVTRTDTIDNKDYGIVLNLFSYADTNIDTGSSTYGSPSRTGINSGKTNENTQLFFYGYGTQGTGINNFTGAGPNPDNPSQNVYTYQYAMQGIVKKDLDKGVPNDPSTWFPVVNTTSADNLSYLFAPYNGNNRTVFPNVSNLFYSETSAQYGEQMIYDSNECYAYYNQTGENAGTFTIYEDTYSRSEGGSGVYPIGFFPLDQYNGTTSYPGACINPTNRLWNSNSHVKHHTGLSMTAPITMPFNGYIYDRDTKQYVPMNFLFSGDDDMWVFIDGHLVLDVGGIHQPVKGTIDFPSGAVEVSSGSLTSLPRTQTDGFTRTATGIVETDGKFLGDHTQMYGTNGSLGADRNSDEWRAGTDHVVQFFYLERGGCDSNLEISSNIHLLSKMKASVEKVWPEGFDTSNRQVGVELVQKATIREKLITPEGTQYVQGHDGYDAETATVYDDPDTANVIEGSRTLSDDAGWTYNWSDLPREGYAWFTRPDGTRDEFYCDFDYYVREVPTPGFDATYSTRYDNGNPKVIEASDYGTLGSDQDTVFLGVSNDVKPVIITNAPTTMEVEKVWLDEAGKNETPNAKHDNDQVYAQLYKQVRTAGGDWGPTNGMPVGEPVLLNKAGNWKKTLEVQERGENVQYFVREGVMNGGVFVATDEIPAARRTYVRDRTEYESTAGTVPETGFPVAPVVSTGTTTASMPYYWTAVDHGTGEEHNWEQSRTYDTTTVVEQAEGAEKDAFTEDTINVQLVISPAAAKMPATPTDALDYTAAISLADGIEFAEGNNPQGFSWSYSEGVLTLTMPAATAREKAGQTLSVPLKVRRPGGADLTALAKSAPAKVTVAQTVYDVCEKATPAPTPTAQKNVGMSIVPFGTAKATLYNKPKLTDISLLKLDADAPATDDYEAGKTPLKGATFIMVKDDGELEGQGTAAHPVYDKTKDTERLPKTSQLNPNQTYTTGDDGKVYLAGSVVKVDDGTGHEVDTPVGLEPGTYWLIETGAPDGYLVRDENYPIGITIAIDGTPALVLDSSYDTATSKTRPTLTGPDANGAYTLAVPDVRLYVLPAAGGPGPLPFLIAGAFAAALAASSVYDDRKRTAR